MSEPTSLSVQTGVAGTHVVSVSTKPREIDLKAKEFNEYLAHNGLPDTLAERRKNKELGKDVRKRHSKRVGAIFQVGDARTDNYKHALGYSVETISQQNPHQLRAGGTPDVSCTLEGKPLANQSSVAAKITRAVSVKAVDA